MPVSLDLDMMPSLPAPTPERPLLGLTVLVVEDSRFASEALRLLCLRSGARIRRADSLAAAQKHLRVYRPNVTLVDLGLPDGSGASLIDELSRAQPRVEVILGMSGDAGAEPMALAAGADGFIEKPIAGLAAFQETILAKLPEDARRFGLRSVSNETVAPDAGSLLEDFSYAADILTAHNGDDMLDYIAQFLAGVARDAGDAEVVDAAETLAKHRQTGAPYRSDVARIAGLVQERLTEQRAV
ncbi:response regulator [Celeribacter sp.]|uniref:response regulator n=1 Tax=Celeribacter sp. TaxID=1890673 RepID=UPI003A951DAA